ncbi:hypothetical protein B0H14DRAFT_1388985 [Mycena olivaceomarginata]|nr:hypothetical protein B0H14DRAFT_1388985 [Mycena olivaceomarginata]
MKLAGNADLHVLVAKMEARMTAQEKRIVVLEQENSELWQEVHRLKGPRLPLELFFLIVAEAREDKKALKTFSLVSKGWMHVAREILFVQIPLLRVKPFLNDPHCTIFPYVRALFIRRDDTKDGTAIPSVITPNWLDDYLVHVPKFTALASLELSHLKSRDLHNIARALPPDTKWRIRELNLCRPDASLSAITNFISNFTQLTTLKCSEMDESRRNNALARLFPSTQAGTDALAAPPPSLTTLLFWETGYLPANVLKWLTARHPGAIELFRPDYLQPEYPAEFRDFIVRFGGSLSEIELSFFNECDAVKLLDAQYLTALSELRCIVLDFHHARLSWLPNIIAQLPPSIERMKIYVDGGHVSRIDEGWPELDQTLAGGTAFPSLCNLTIWIRHANYYSKQQILQILLPLSAEKRILALEVDFP